MNSPPNPGSPLTMVAAPTAKDPVCGMNVKILSATPQHHHEGRTYHFCCAGCAQKFRNEPAKYLNRAAQPLVTLAPARAKIAPPTPLGGYICPMDPDVHEAKPGPCPRCG